MKKVFLIGGVFLNTRVYSSAILPLAARTRARARTLVATGQGGWKNRRQSYAKVASFAVRHNKYLTYGYRHITKSSGRLAEGQRRKSSWSKERETFEELNQKLRLLSDGKK